MLAEIKAYRTSIRKEVRLAIAGEIKRVGRYAKAETEVEKQTCLRKGAELLYGKLFENGQLHMPDIFHQKSMCDGVVGNDRCCIAGLINNLQAFMLPLSGSFLISLYKRLGYMDEASPARGIVKLLSTYEGLFVHVPWKDMPMTHFLYFLGAVVCFQSSFVGLISITDSC
jgi:hypothetical protein